MDWPTPKLAAVRRRFQGFYRLNPTFQILDRPAPKLQPRQLLSALTQINAVHIPLLKSSPSSVPSRALPVAPPHLRCCYRERSHGADRLKNSMWRPGTHCGRRFIRSDRRGLWVPASSGVPICPASSGPAAASAGLASSSPLLRPAFA